MFADGAKPPAFNGSYSTAQKNKLSAAHDKAYQMIKSAISQLDSGTPASNQKYKTWFGAYDPTRYSKVKIAFGKAKQALESNTYTYDSTNNGGVGACAANVYAWTAYTHVKIFTCSGFWDLPEDGLTMASTLVHEYLHIVDEDIIDLAAGTNDAACKGLAAGSPAEAIKNGGNYQRFVEAVGTDELGLSVKGQKDAENERVKRGRRLVDEGKVYPKGCSGYVSAVLKRDWENAEKLMGANPTYLGVKNEYDESKVKPGDVVGWLKKDANNNVAHVAIFVGKKGTEMIFDVPGEGKKPRRVKNGYGPQKLYKSTRF
jgi:hypothetical protein